MPAVKSVASGHAAPRALRQERSKKLYAQARRCIPGGVNSPVRAFAAVGGEPLFISRGQGPYVYDVDGNRFIDYVGSYGPLILGHAPATVLASLQEAAAQGLSFGAPTAREIWLAESVLAAFPSMAQVRFTSSGTEATMSAIRVCRAASGKAKILKFAGGYHGHADAFLTTAGSGLATLGIPGSAGVTAATAAETLTLPYNDLAAVEQLLRLSADDLAAIIVEPIACNMGLVCPTADFLPGLRQLCDHYGVLLIFDEVISGFRVALGGAQALYGVRPDMTTLGKIVGGGLPVGAYGGRADLMQLIAPQGPVYQAGTLSGNPLAMAAGLATLERLQQPHFYANLEALGALFEQGMRSIITQRHAPCCINRVGSIIYIYFSNTSEPVAAPRNYAEICQGNTQLYATFFQHLLCHGVHLAPSAFEVGFISAAHTPQQLEATLSAVDQIFAQMFA